MNTIRLKVNELKNKIMKKIISTLYIIFITTIAYSQCWKDIKTNTTHWNIHDLVGGIERNQNYGDFDWTAESYSKFYLAYLPPGFSNPVTLTLPMWKIPGSTLSTNDNTYHFTSIPTIEEKDFHPEDGWELLNKDFGQPGAANNTTSNPFFALYNRYTGKIRVFFLTPEKLNDVTSALVKMEFIRQDGKRITGMFQNIKPITKVLIELDNTLSFSTPNYTSAGVYFYWYTADFVVTYDPCTCNNITNKTSDLKLSLVKITSADISITMNGTSKQLITNSIKQTDGDASHSFSDLKDFDTWKALYGDGQAAFKSWDANASNFKKWLDGLPSVQEKEVEKSIKQYRDYLLVMDSQDPISLLPNPSTKDIANAIGANTKNYKKFLGIKFPQNSIEGIKNVASVVPYVGTAISIYEFFSGGGTTSDNNEKAAAPVVYTQNLSAVGNITATQDFSTATFSVPGTANSTTSAYIPHYNNILGVFNILQIPKLEYIQYLPKASPNWYSCIGEDLSIFENNVKEYDKTLNQYRLISDLKYVLNPAANVEVFSIDAAYVIEYKSNQTAFGAASGDYFPITDFRHLEGNECYSYPVNGNILEHNFKDLMYLKNTEFFIENIFKDSLVSLRTKYVPINSFRYHSFFLEENNSNNNAPKISIKLLIKLQRKDNPNAEKITLIHTYDFTNAISNAQKNSMQNLMYEKKFLYEKNINPDNTYTVSGQEVVGKLESYWTSLDYSIDEITIPPNSVISADLYARKKINIGSNVVINTGVILMAGKEIAIHPDNIYHPNVTLITGLSAFPGWHDNPLTLHNQDWEIASICDNNIYKDKVNVFNKKENTNTAIKPLKVKIETFLFPNPAKDNIQLKIFFPYSFDNGGIQIFDYTGKLFYQDNINVFKPGYSALEIDVSSFSSGVYFLKVNTPFEENASRFLVIN